MCFVSISKGSLHSINWRARARQLLAEMDLGILLRSLPYVRGSAPPSNFVKLPMPGTDRNIPKPNYQCLAPKLPMPGTETNAWHRNTEIYPKLALGINDLQPIPHLMPELP